MSGRETGWRVRPWAASDAGPLTALLQLVYRHEPVALDTQSVHGPDRDDAGAFGRTLVAEWNGALLGAGTLWESWLAPARWRVSLQVYPQHRRAGIGSALLEQFVALAAERDRRPLQVGIRADDEEGLRFLARHGFCPLMRTRQGLFPSGAMAQMNWEVFDTATARTAAAGYRIAVMPELPADIVHQDALAALHAEVYRLAHAWSPPAPLDEATARPIFLGEDLIPAALFVTLAKDEPIAVASLRHGPAPGDIDLGWVGVAERHQELAPDLTAALVGGCLRHAVVQGWSIRIEVDEADRDLWDLMEGLPVAREPDWLNLERADGRTL